ncbi:TraB/GumN family protein [Chitinophaga solisilvae]|uniref:TraB/GumN family protein n=1 Tax=Chitinophaga solisilvae TaxID=1233460 RepID=UPI00136DCFAB|nr:TraB/GumN family protein [Chitinophaga solisilvae]
MLYSYINPRPGTHTNFPCLIGLLLLLLLPAATLQAQHTGKPSYQLLWRIDAPGSTTPSYLFGTMHMTDRRVFEFSDSVLIALRNTSSFAMEVDMDSIMSYMFSPHGPMLDTVNHMRRLLNKDEYRYVDSLIIEKTGAPIEKLYVKRLWFIEKLLLDEEQALKNANPDQKTEHTFLDGWLHQKATILEKPVHSLERMQNQLHFMSADVSDVQKDVFLWNIGYTEAGNSHAKEKSERFNTRVTLLDSLVNIYHTANLQKIGDVVNSWGESTEGPGLLQRNLEMTDNLTTLISKGSVFAAVGVAHLPGEKGILSLLRSKGFTVTAVKADFTGVARRERQRLDSVKGYPLNKIAEGYSVMLPGTPIAYQLPNINRKMYIGNASKETGFALAMDIALLGSDKTGLVNMMLTNMARQSNGVLKKSYPVSYRNLPGTEAVMMNGQIPFYVRIFILNNRAFMFMHASEEKDSTARINFFRSVRFYDIVRPATVYTTLPNPQLGFSALLPSTYNHVNTGSNKQARPEEIFTALDNANSISYVIRVEKMQSGYYNTNDKKILEDLRNNLLEQDSSIVQIDSTVTEQHGLPVYNLVFKHPTGFISRLSFIPRGNIAYCLLCIYNGTSTDSSYWKRFREEFQILPLAAKAPVVPFMAADSSFSIAGPALFTGGPLGEQNTTSPVQVDYYTSMDSASHSMYIVEVDKYSPYFHNDPDSILQSYLFPADTNFIVADNRKSVWESQPAYETVLKGNSNGLRWYRKAIVAGHTVYRLSVIQPEELVSKGFVQQFFSSFHAGNKQKNDTRRLQQKKLNLLLTDLQSTDTTVFNSACRYLTHFSPDSTDRNAIIQVLSRPFPADKQHEAGIKLLSSLENLPGDDVVHAAEIIFTDTKDTEQRKKILQLLTRGLASDSAIRTFIRLAPVLPESNTSTQSIISHSFKVNKLYKQYLPAMINVAKQSGSFLQALVTATWNDSLWMAPQADQYETALLIPAITKQFEDLLKTQRKKIPEDEQWRWQRKVYVTGHILALPGTPAGATSLFRELLKDTITELRGLGVRGLINHDIMVDDKIINGILNDYVNAYPFIDAVKSDHQLPHIRHLLSQEVVARGYIGNYLSDDYNVTALEHVTQVKVQDGKQPAEWLYLYRFQVDDNPEWEYELVGPFSADTSTLNFEPELLHSISDATVIRDKKKLTAEAGKAYHDYLEELK